MDSPSRLVHSGTCLASHSLLFSPALLPAPRPFPQPRQDACSTRHRPRQPVGRSSGSAWLCVETVKSLPALPSALPEPQRGLLSLAGPLLHDPLPQGTPTWPTPEYVVRAFPEAVHYLPTWNDSPGTAKWPSPWCPPAPRAPHHLAARWGRLSTLTRPFGPCRPQQQPGLPGSEQEPQ